MEINKRKKNTSSNVFVSFVSDTCLRVFFFCFFFLLLLLLFFFCFFLNSLLMITIPQRRYTAQFSVQPDILPKTYSLCAKELVLSTSYSIQ